MYKTRHIEEKLLLISKSFKVVLINGARQVGKSTLVQHLFPNAKHITFNPVSDDFGAQKDPALFLANNPSPLILDEIQYVPDLLALIKMEVDRNKEAGQYILTGSQNFAVLKAVSESLAGRVAILNLSGMTLFEKHGKPDVPWIMPYINNVDNFHRLIRKQIQLKESIYELIWRGSFPGTLDFANELIHDFYSSYIQTYVERDIKLISDVRDPMEFTRFLGICAALTAQEVNYMHIGREIGVTHTTAHRWLDALRNSFQWFELNPFVGNAIKKITKKSKGYVTDTGMVCYLQRISSPMALQNHPAFGSLFETYVVNNIKTVLGSYTNASLYHWRTRHGSEVGVIVEKDNTLYPIEIKGKTNITKNDLRGIKAFVETYSGSRDIAPAIVVYLGKEVVQLEQKIFAVPFNSIVSE